MALALSNIEIIFVEDGPRDIELAFEAFTNVGVQNNVIHLKDGKEAIDFLTKAEKLKGAKFGNKANLIIVDLHLPNLQGVEVLKAVKNNPDTKHIPVVILAGSKKDPLKFTCLELGADQFLIKPITAEAFKKTIESLEHYWN
ncbi:MAG: rcp1 [Bacteroidetes bacterium]|jgi:CheY-like chemotaxis protein|nr:rcp1 [Bacteroidota bacterium]